MSAAAGDHGAVAAARPPRSGRFRPSRKVLAPAAFLVAVVLVWEAWLRIAPVSGSVIVPPSTIFNVMRGNLPLLLEHTWVTFTEIVFGFAISAVVGMALGTLITITRWTKHAFYPNLVFFQLIPKAALAPLFILWLGFGISSRVAFAVFMSFFPIALATATGLENTRGEAIRLCRSLTASRWQTFAKVRVPFALGHIFSGLKVGMTMSMIGVVVAEFINAQQGLGYIVLFASSAGQSAPLYAALVLLALLGLSLYACVVVVENLVQRWYGAPFASEGYV